MNVLPSDSHNRMLHAQHAIHQDTETSFGVLVDRVLGMEHAVVRSLGKTFKVVRSLQQDYRRHEALSGATILCDGNVALILDVSGVERLAFGAVQ